MNAESTPIRLRDLSRRVGLRSHGNVFQEEAKREFGGLEYELNRESRREQW